LRYSYFQAIKISVKTSSHITAWQLHDYQTLIILMKRYANYEFTMQSLGTVSMESQRESPV